MMNKSEIVSARRALLQAEIDLHGLTAIANKAEKPVRQIKDMASRNDRSFGDGIAREIGPKIRPDLPRDWLVFPESPEKYKVREASAADYLKLDPKISQFIPKSQRDKDLSELLRLANLIDDTGLGMLLRDAQKLCKERPIMVKQTQKSSK